MNKQLLNHETLIQADKNTVMTQYDTPCDLTMIVVGSMVYKNSMVYKKLNQVALLGVRFWVENVSSPTQRKTLELQGFNFMAISLI